MALSSLNSVQLPQLQNPFAPVTSLAQQQGGGGYIPPEGAPVPMPTFQQPSSQQLLGQAQMAKGFGSPSAPQSITPNSATPPAAPAAPAAGAAAAPAPDPGATSSWQKMVQDVQQARAGVFGAGGIGQTMQNGVNNAQSAIMSPIAQLLAHIGSQGAPPTNLPLPATTPIQPNAAAQAGLLPVPPQSPLGQGVL